MRVVAFALVAVGLFGLSARAVRADDEKELIVGVWEITYAETQVGLPVGTKLEFTAEGKLMLIRKDKDGKERTSSAGMYKIEKGYLLVSEKEGEKPDKGRICLLNKTALVLNDETVDEVMVLKRTKAK
jgi:uncharacterized protein (TIGR03066 family)